jgi:hypothetical protein
MKLIGTKEGSALIFMREFEGKVKTIKYDLKDDSFYAGTPKGNWRLVKSVDNFFRNISADEVVESFEDPMYQKFLKLVKDAAPDNVTNMATMMGYISRLKHYESWVHSGLPYRTPSLSRNYKSKYVSGYTDDEGRYHPSKTIKEVKIHMSYFSLQHGVNLYQKDVLEFMREVIRMEGFDEKFGRDWEDCYVENVDWFVKICRYVRQNYHMDLEVYKWVYDMLKDDHDLEKFVKMVTPHETTKKSLEYKAMFDYLVQLDRREALSFNTAISLLSDYLDMNEEMGNSRAPRYPRFLRLRHDITTRNYEVNPDDFNTDIFRSKVNYNLDWMGKEWAVVAPLTPLEMKEEGNKLHHCVAQYIKKVYNGWCQIMFLRKLEKGSDPLVTVEIKMGKIKMALGDGNRETTEEEQAALMEFAKAKRLFYQDYIPTEDIKADKKKADKKEMTNEKRQEIGKGSQEDSSKEEGSKESYPQESYIPTEIGQVQYASGS